MGLGASQCAFEHLVVMAQVGLDLPRRGGVGRGALGRGVDDQAASALGVAGRGTGRAFVYDVGSGELIQALRTPEAERTLINDLTETVIPIDTSFGLNGISASDDGEVLLTVHFDSGRLFRIDVATREVTEVDLGPDLLTTGDHTA